MLELTYNLFKKKNGYSITVAATEDGNVLYEDELAEVTGLRKNALIARKKSVTLNGKVLTFGLNIINDKLINK